ncbi:MAG: hypothetical protein ABH983_03940 [Candidatus Micrarchaeota archaeon]
MPKRKILAFNRERPQIRKNLFFPTLVLATALSACTSARVMMPRTATPIRETIQQPVKEYTPPEKACDLNEPRWLEPGEEIQRTVCSNGFQYTLTDTSLLIVENHRDLGDIFRDFSLDESRSRTDMREIIANGVVDWSATEDHAFFLTKDGILTAIPSGEMGDSLPTFAMPEEFRRGKLASRSGFLFIAAPGRLMVGKLIEDRFDSMIIDLPSKAGDLNFEENQGKLFLRNEREKIEIEIQGPGIGDIRVR